MKEDQGYKYVCKYCNKSFPCGRSLGGHVRSHLSNNSTETDERVNTRKLSSINNDKIRSKTSFELRENPKKTKKAVDSIEETSICDKLCKQCGKGYQSWKALFGHMKCHSDYKERVSNSFEEQDSFVMDSQSDNENTVPSRRSKRKTRYMFTTTSSSVSEIEQEQEEVALCLMMLSRDVSGFNSFMTESSDNDSVFLEAPKSIQFDSVKLKVKGNQVHIDGFLKNDGIKEHSEAGFHQLEFGSNSLKRRKFECATCNKTFHSYQALGGHRASHKKNKGCFASNISETSTDIEEFNKPNNNNNPEFPLEWGEKEVITEKKSKKVKEHECPICLKMFSSGQALGGHKRSHITTGAEARHNQPIIVQNPVAEIRDCIDLNLPAPVEDDTDGNDGFKAWWTGNKHKHEDLLGLMAN